MIALLCPSRGRPEGLKRMLQSVGATTDRTVKNVFCGLAVNQDDYVIYGDIFANKGRTFGVITVPDNLPTVHKWNLLAEEALENTEAKLFMLASDDMIFDRKGWDKALIDHYNALENKIHCYALQDSRDKDGTPHPIVTREYIEAMGYFLPPIFLHWFGDTWTVKIAKYNNCFMHLKDYKLVHDKPSDRGEADETHTRIRDFGWHDRDKWVDQHCGHLCTNESQRLMALMRKD